MHVVISTTDVSDLIHARPLIESIQLFLSLDEREGGEATSCSCQTSPPDVSVSFLGARLFDTLYESRYAFLASLLGLQ